MKTTEVLTKYRNDLLLVSGILLIALIGFAIFKLTLKDGNNVAVSVDGAEKFVYSITEEIETNITTGENGEQTNVLVIKNGEAYVQSANCPDKICAGHRAISKVGETIVCLPHKVVIAITDSDN